MPLAITAPAGHIGSHLVPRLLDAGRTDLVLLLRDADALAPDVRDRVEAREGDLTDADYVRDATRDADALYWISPNNWGSPSLFGWYDRLVPSVVAAVEGGVGHVVHQSSVGAEDPGRYGPVSGLHRVAAAIDAAADRSGAAVRHVHGGFFYENFAGMAEPVVGEGRLYLPVEPDWRTPMVATADVAARVAEILLDLSWDGVGHVTAYGPEVLSYAEAAAALGRGVGRDVELVTVPQDAVAAQLRQAGASESWAEGLAALYASMGAPGFPDVPAWTAGDALPTTLEAWARDELRPADRPV